MCVWIVDIFIQLSLKDSYVQNAKAFGENTMNKNTKEMITVLGGLILLVMLWGFLAQVIPDKFIESSHTCLEYNRTTCVDWRDRTKCERCEDYIRADYCFYRCNCTPTTRKKGTCIESGLTEEQILKGESTTNPIGEMLRSPEYKEELYGVGIE